MDVQERMMSRGGCGILEAVRRPAAMTSETPIAEKTRSSEQVRAPSGTLARRGVVPKMLNHVAYVTHDAAATTDFYTRLLGMELVHTVMADRLPSTGDPFPYFHLFFRLGDGSTIAFFESPGLPAPAKPSHPAYDIFDHIAFEVESPATVEAWRDWLTQHGIDVIGPINHGVIYSIYFRDPNGVRLELTTPLTADWNQRTEQSYRDLARWEGAKERARREGKDIRAALLDLIRNTQAAAR
jgi:catechol 2,3-dioxygenase-like lactoylglutathione lyase family enzyme